MKGGNQVNNFKKVDGKSIVGGASITTGTTTSDLDLNVTSPTVSSLPSSLTSVNDGVFSTSYGRHGGGPRGTN